MNTQLIIILLAVIAVITALWLVFRRSGVSRTLQIDPSMLEIGPIRHDTLSESLIARIHELQPVFAEVYPRTMEEWIDGFKHDLRPEREVAIWEAMASAYSSFITNRTLTSDARHEVFGFLLQRSMDDKRSVLASAAPKHLTRPEVEELVSLYSAAPQPLIVIPK